MSTTPFAQITSPPQASAEIVLNENLAALRFLGVYARNFLTSSGLTFGYYGGRWGGFAIADGMLTLPASTTVYVTVSIADGSIAASADATNWNDATGHVRLYLLTTSGSSVSATDDYRAGPRGLFFGSGSSSAPTPPPAPAPAPGFVRDWNDNATTGQTLFGALSPTDSASGGTYKLKTGGAATAASSLNNSPSVADFDATITVTAFAEERSGLIYRTLLSQFNNGNFGFKYSVGVFNNKVNLLYAGTTVSETMFPTPLVDGTLVTLRVKVAADKHQIYVNGTKYIDVSDTSNLGAGNFGLLSIMQSQPSVFDNLSISY